MKNYTINWTQLISYIVIAVLIGILFNTCNKEKLATANAEKYKKEQTKLNDEVVKADYKISKYTDTISELEKQVEKYKVKIANLDSKFIPKIEGVKHYNSNDIAKFYKSEYKLPNQVVTVAKGILLSDTVARLNIRDVFLGKLSEGKLAQANYIINDQYSIIKYKDSSLVQKDTINTKLTKALSNCDKANDNCNIENKKTRKSNLLLKLGLGFLVIIGIVF